MRRARGLGLLLALSFVAAACSDGDPRPPAIEHGTTESDAPAVPGGRLVIGTEAEPDGFDPTASRFTTGVMTYALAIFDPLMAFDAEGNVVPYLAESLSHDDDHVVWTLVLRDGVTFSNGEPLTAAAVVRAFDGHRASELTRPVLRSIESVAATDERTVELRMAQPWAAFPVHLTGQLGLVPAPSMLDDLEDGYRNPIGTGPFVIDRWAPGDRMVLTRNPTYWRRDEGVPYLDEVELRPIADASARAGALAAGLIDVMQTDDVDGIAALRDFEDIGTAYVTEGAISEHVLVFNVATPPFDDVRCRRAVSAAIDRDALVDALGPDVVVAPADPGNESADGDGCDFTYRTGASTRDGRIGEVVRDALGVAGIEVTVAPSDAAALTLDALLGRFEALGWTQDGTLDVDERFASLDARNAGPIGTLAVNVGRFADDELQEALLGARAAANAEDRAELAATIDELLAEKLPFVTLVRIPWAYGFDPAVGGVRRGLTLPDGGAALPRPGILLAAELHLTAAP